LLQHSIHIACPFGAFEPCERRMVVEKRSDAGALRQNEALGEKGDSHPRFRITRLQAP
jgi:hypothetical protein